MRDVDVQLQLALSETQLHDAARGVLQRLLPAWKQFDKSDIKVPGLARTRDRTAAPADKDAAMLGNRPKFGCCPLHGRPK